MEYSIEQQLKDGQPVVVRTKGISMQPLLYQGQSHVILAPVKQEPAIGELVLYRTPENVYILHRIVDKTDRCYITRGDHCISHEEVPKEWVIGVVVEIYRSGKSFSTSALPYRLYTFIWLRIYPVWRIYLLFRQKWQQNRTGGKL